MAMDPRNHPRGSPPSFDMTGLPPNPTPKRITRELWWLVCMRLLLEPRSKNGGVFADKPGYHNAGENLPDHGLGDGRTDHSIRRAPDRSGKWWREYASAHDWTFDRAHSGNYTEIKKYCNRLRNAMRDPNDLRPDDVYSYFIGQINDDPIVEGQSEYTDGAVTGDKTHLWHRHDSFRRNIVGSFPHMWQALTIDMGWTYAEWLRSVTPQEDDMPTAEQIADAVWAKKLARPHGEPVAAGTILGWRDAVAVDSRARAADDEAETRRQILAAIAADDVDEQAIVAGVLAGMTGEQIEKVIRNGMSVEDRLALAARLMQV